MPRPSKDFYTEQEQLQDQGLRRCHRCQEIKQLDVFPRSSTTKSGYLSNCKACRSEESLRCHRRTRAEEPLYTRLIFAKQRAVKAGARIDVFTPADLRNYWRSRGIDSERSIYSGKPLPKGWHLDHITPLSQGGGHTMDNLVPCLPSENSSKGDRHFIHLLSTIHNPTTEERETVAA